MCDEEFEAPTWFDKSCALTIVANYESPSIINDVTSFTLGPGSKKGENFASTLLLLSAEYVMNNGEHKKATFIVKTKLENEMMSGIEIEFNVFTRESEAYKHILPEMHALLRSIGDKSKFGPRFIYIDEKMIVLENLKEKGYKIENVLEGLEKDQVAIILEKLAKFHACSMVLYEKKPDLFKHHMGGNMSEVENPLHAIYNNGMQTCIEYCATRPQLEEYVPRLKEVAPKIVPRMINVFSRNQIDRYHGLNHGDCWVNNFMFLNKVESLLFVDYQEGYFGSPGIDLNFLLYSSLTKETYACHKEELLAGYQKVLSETLEKLKYTQRIPTLDDVHKEIVNKSYHGLCTTTIMLPLLLNSKVEYSDPSNFILETEEAVANRLKIYNNPRYDDLAKLFFDDFISFGIL